MTYQMRLDERYAEGISVGRDEGIAVGFDKGISVGEKRGERRGISIGRTEGISIGSHERAVDDARRALECGIPVATVAKFTGLPLDEVRRLM